MNFIIKKNILGVNLISIDASVPLNKLQNALSALQLATSIFINFPAVDPI